MKYIFTLGLAICTLSAGAQTKGKAVGHDKEIAGAGHAYGHHKGEPTTTVPSLVKAKFETSYPGTKASWSKKGRSYYTAGYTEGGYHTYTTYTATGSVVETSIDLPIEDAPKAVAIYKDANPNVGIKGIIRLLQPNKGPLYRLETTKGNFIYINESGAKVTL